MNFIVDAQLPRKLSNWLTSTGHNAVHTLDLPKANETEDIVISELADAENRIVISKDQDFLDDHLIKDCPKKLLAIKTGNITNKDLINLFEMNFDVIVQLLENHNLVEIDRKSIIAH